MIEFDPITWRTTQYVSQGTTSTCCGAHGEWACLLCPGRARRDYRSGGGFQPAPRSRRRKSPPPTRPPGPSPSTETTDEGYYKIPYLPAGKYKLTVEKDGFAINRVTDVPVLVGQIATINVTLKPGSIHDEVTVTSNAVMVDQVSSSLGYVTGATQILELPTGRSPYSLMTLSPGVIATGNTGTGPIVSGGRSNTTAILLDGQDTRNNSTLDNAYTPPQETVQEVRFITNNFSAEYGRSAGGVLVAAGKTRRQPGPRQRLRLPEERQAECQQLGQQPEQCIARPAAPQRIRVHAFPARCTFPRFTTGATRRSSSSTGNRSTITA